MGTLGAPFHETGAVCFAADREPLWLPAVTQWECVYLHHLSLFAAGGVLFLAAGRRGEPSRVSTRLHSSPPILHSPALLAR